MKLAVGSVLLLACGGPAKPVAPPAAPAGLTISATAIGPVDARTPATLAGLRTSLAGYDVRPVNQTSLEFDVWKDGERLFYVVPDDHGGVFNVHAVSTKVTVTGHDWKVGAPFPAEAGLVTAAFDCDCWGEETVCFQKEDHVAAAFVRSGCDGFVGDDNARNRAVLVGLPIERMVWSPKPFGAVKVKATDPWAPKQSSGNPCSGGESGGVEGGMSGDPCGD